MCTLLRVHDCFFSQVNNDIPSSSSEVKPEQSKLDTRVAKFISLICNVSMMAQHMMEIGLSLTLITSFK